MSEEMISAERAMLCPGCGYDLRGAPENRCSECGLVIDRESLRRSNIPWAHRRSIGRVKAFVKTSWLMMIDAKSLQHEAAKPQSPRDAAGYRRIVTLLLAASLMVLAWQLLRNDVIDELTVKKDDPFTIALSGAMPGPLPAVEWLVPWSAGVSLAPAWYVYAFLCAICLSHAPSATLRTRGLILEQANAARALGAYVSAPLTLLVPAIVAFTALYVITEGDMNTSVHRHGQFPTALMFAYSIFGIIGFAATIHRTGQWRARVMRGGYATGFAAMGELVLCWIVGLLAVLAVVPWCVGFLRIFFETFQP